MIFKNTIKRFVLEEVEKEYKSGNYAAYAPFMDTLLSRNTPLKSTNLDRRLIHYWESRKLFNEVSDNGYLSFFDVSWLNVLQELKVIGVTPKTMEEVHKFFFGNNSFLDTLFSKSNIEKLAFSSKEIDDLSKSKDLLQMLKNYGWNNFSLTILAILLTRKNTCLHVSAGGKVAAFEVADIIDPSDSFGRLNKIFNESFISVSLYNIIYKVINDNDLFNLNDGVLEIKEASINIIKKMFNDDAIQKITFRLNDKRMPIVEVTKRLDFAEFYNKVHYLKKKGTFLDMQIKTRDGNVQLFEVTELINTK
jgi:DNA-binding transcriptional MerR regulator